MDLKLITVLRAMKIEFLAKINVFKILLKEMKVINFFSKYSLKKNN